MRVLEVALCRRKVLFERAIQVPRHFGVQQTPDTQLRFALHAISLGTTRAQFF